MLGWIFRKKGPAPASVPAVAAKSLPSPAAPPMPAVDWAGRLAQARGDDDALLALMRTARLPLQLKQAAVEALEGEAALKLAERDCRSHDRRIHQLAKRRLLAAVTRRQTREKAAQLIETARSLLAESDVAVNRGVDLDRAWQALDAESVAPAVREQFAALTAQLAAQMRQRTDLDAHRKRWQTDALLAVQRLNAACAKAAAGTQDRAELASAASTAQGVLDAQPPAAAAGPLAALQQAVQTATTLDSHLAVLERLLTGRASALPAAGLVAATERVDGQPSVGESDVDTGLETEPSVTSMPLLEPAESLQRAWRELPPLQDAPLAALLQARHARWQQDLHQVLQDRQTQRREQARERQRARKGEQGAALTDWVAQTEAALDAGQLDDAHRHLNTIDEALDSADVSDALSVRISAAQARLAQLRGWQQWAGGRARDELVLQAEALAAATGASGARGGGSANDGAKASDDSRNDSGADSSADLSAIASHSETQPDTERSAEAYRHSEADAEVARLSIRQRADLIAALRARWKDIDRLGGPGAQALWRRFDAALKAADEPVVAHLAAQRAAREANLSARLQLLNALDSLGGAASPAPVPSAAPEVLADPAAASPTPPHAPLDAPADVLADTHARAIALDRFHAEWRKLGPLEHTVPRAARAALVAEMEAVTQRIDAPLQAARRQARAEREALVARAQTLVEAGAGRGRDVVAEVRLLQAEWQRHAKSVPLARADEQGLWTAFKAAIDAAFAAREAVSRERDAEFEAHAAERQALIARLQLRPDDTLAMQRRTLAEVDAAWQRCGPAPRARANAIEAEFRAARDALSQWLGTAAQRAWHATCGALDAKLALCQAHEQGAAESALSAATWQALPALPAPLEHALRRRAGLAPELAAEAEPAVDDLLLQIEAAWNLSTPPAFEAARRERKLLAMKAALEGRSAAAPVALPTDTALARLLGRAGLNAEQFERLQAVLAAWRQQGPQSRA